MAKISLDSIVSGFKSVSKLIANFDKIEDDLNDKVLYRDNPTGEPNQMENNLDMNSQRIVNLVSPVNDSEPARWADVKNGVTGIDEPVPSQTGNAKTPLTTSGTGLVFGQIEADHVDFTNSGTGGVERTLKSVLSDFVSVKDFATVAEAVAHCYTNSLGLYWPEVETVVVNIPNLHDVRHFGAGGITRGSNTWYVEQSPNQENRTLYVSSASGSNTNDGLDTTYPLQYEPYALTAMLTINPNSGEQGFITLKNDHVIVDESMMVVEKVNAGWITINSDGTYGESNYTYSAVDKVSGWTAGTPNPVTCSCTASTASRYVVATEADAPDISIYVDGNAQLDRLYSLNRSRGVVNETYGGQNFRNDVSDSRPLYANGGELNASKTVWINYHSQIYFARGASVNFSGSLVKNATITVNGALTVSRGAAVEAMGFEAQSCAFPIEVKRAGSSLNVFRAVIDDTSNQVAIVHRGGTLSLGGAKITETAIDGILVNDGGTLEFASGGTSYGFGELYATSGNTTGYGIKCAGSGQCGARSVTIEGFKYNVWALNTGKVDISSATITNSDTHNVWATDGSFITCSAATITGAGSHNVVCTEGSHISCINATVTGAATNDIYVLDGGFVTAFDTTTSTAGSTPNTADTNLSTFSELTKKGYILAD